MRESKLHLPPPVPGRLAILDTEFTSLDKAGRQMWECGGIILDPGAEPLEFEVQVRPDLSTASPDSVRIGRYYQRCRIHAAPVGTALVVVAPGIDELKLDQPVEDDRLTTAVQVADELATVLADAVLIGAVPSADELTLERFLSAWGQILTTHYRLRCVETLAHGYLLGRRAERARHIGADLDMQPIIIPDPPWHPKELFPAVGVALPSADRAHRALVDARCALNVWNAVHRH